MEHINSLVNYNFVTTVDLIHVFWLGRIIVAVPCQDIIDTSKPHVVLAGHCDNCVQCTIYMYNTVWYTIAVLMRSINRQLTHNVNVL